MEYKFLEAAQMKTASTLREAHKQIKEITKIANNNANSCNLLAEEIDRQRETIKIMQSLTSLAQDIVTHPCWNGNKIPKSLKARRDLYVEAWDSIAGV